MADAGRAMMLYRGMYDSTYNYEKLDVVNFNGSLYISTTDGNLGTEPTEETKWKLFLQGGVSDNIQATDTYGLVGKKGDSSFVQLLLDSLASRIGKDGNGNVISETYSTKNEMSVLNPFKFVYYTDSDITERISDIDSVDPYVFGHMENCPISSYLVFVVTYKYDDYTLQVCWGNGEMATRYYAKDGTWTNWKTGVNRSNILNTLEEIDANTSEGNIAGALAVKSLKSNLTNSLNANKTTSHAYGVQSYNSADNIFTATHDGYLLMNTWGNEKIITHMCNSDGTIIISISCSAGESKSIFTHKGQKMWFEYASLNSVQFIFARLT